MQVMHRLHESLPSGVTRGTTSWATCRRRTRGRCGLLPTITEEDGTHSDQTPLETRIVTRARGEALRPAREQLAAPGLAERAFLRAGVLKELFIKERPTLRMN